MHSLEDCDLVYYLRLPCPHVTIWGKVRSDSRHREVHTFGGWKEALFCLPQNVTQNKCENTTQKPFYFSRCQEDFFPYYRLHFWPTLPSCCLLLLSSINLLLGPIKPQVITLPPAFAHLAPLDRTASPPRHTASVLSWSPLPSTQLQSFHDRGDRQKPSLLANAFQPLQGWGPGAAFTTGRPASAHRAAPWPQRKRKLPEGRCSILHSQITICHPWLYQKKFHTTKLKEYVYFF